MKDANSCHILSLISLRGKEILHSLEEKGEGRQFTPIIHVHLAFMCSSTFFGERYFSLSIYHYSRL